MPHRQIALLAALLGALLVSVPASAVPMPGWSKPLRIYAAAAKPAHSMAADSLANVHVALAGSSTIGVIYATNAWGTWTHERVTAHADRDPSIAVDSDGIVYIAFARTDDVPGIYVASNETGDWVETLWHAGADRFPSIVVRGTPSHIYLAFRSAANSLMYESNSTGSLKSQTVEAGCCAGAPSLRLTAAGLPRIAYAKLQGGVARSLRFALRTAGGTWTLRTIDAAASSDPTLVLNVNDDAYVIYVRRLGGTYWAYGGAAGTSWSRTLLKATAHMKPDMEVYYAQTYFVYGTPQTLYYTHGSSGIYSEYTLSTTHKDSNPEFEGMHIVFTRAGTSGDGIFFTKSP